MDRGLLVFESKSTREYNEKMTEEALLTLIQSILPKLESNRVTVMDNAYHSVELRVPTISWRKDSIIGLKIMAGNTVLT
jgi:hypothetical protein